MVSEDVGIFDKINTDGDGLDLSDISGSVSKARSGGLDRIRKTITDLIKLISLLRDLDSNSDIIEYALQQLQILVEKERDYIEEQEIIDEHNLLIAEQNREKLEEIAEEVRRFRKSLSLEHNAALAREREEALKEQLRSYLHGQIDGVNKRIEFRNINIVRIKDEILEIDRELTAGLVEVIDLLDKFAIDDGKPALNQSQKEEVISRLIDLGFNEAVKTDDEFVSAIANILGDEYREIAEKVVTDEAFKTGRERRALNIEKKLEKKYELQSLEEENKADFELIEGLKSDLSNLETASPDLTQEPSELVDESVDEEGSLNFDDPGFTLESWEEKIKKLGERLNSGELDKENLETKLTEIRAEI